jgi:hypothetical protein
MTSASTFPQRLTEIDDLTRPDHFYLMADDACYFLGEYTARKGFAFSPTNQLVLNFKKSLVKRGSQQWKYKEQAMGQAATAFRAALVTYSIALPWCQSLPRRPKLIPSTMTG